MESTNIILKIIELSHTPVFFGPVAATEIGKKSCHLIVVIGWSLLVRLSFFLSG